MKDLHNDKGLSPPLRAIWKFHATQNLLTLNFVKINSHKIIWLEKDLESIPDSIKSVMILEYTLE